MNVIGLVPHRERPVALELARDTAAWFRAQGVEVRLPASAAGPARLDEYAVDDASFARGLDLVLSLGGDGTMLHTVHLVYPAPVPIVGVNVGQLA